MIKQVKYQKTADLLGALFSLLCTIHCAITPLIFIAKPLMGNASHSLQDGWWGLLDFVFLTFGLAAVWYSTGHTSHQIYKILLWVFWALFASSILLEITHIEVGEWLMYSSSIALATIHLLNYRYCRKCKD